MTLHDYISSCRQFAEDTAAWGGLDRYKHYVAVAHGGWVESADNAENGIDLSWAFGLPADRLNEAAAAEEYAAAFDAEIRLAEDDEWDEEQRRALYEKFEDCQINENGHVFTGQWDAITGMMEPEIAEGIDEDTRQEFFDAYAHAYAEKYGETWDLSKANPVW